ncbi:AMP-binding protein [Pseudofulvibacter geojedonensis]|uniref:AMP-binding protein n=1 Tax=Pseudofulvibacter geojedonensis TaxID=1123758 RepID=A0ABW3I2R9_9FLAO
MIHSSFKINSTSFTKDSLVVYANLLLHNKEQYLIDIGSFLLDWLDNSKKIKVQTSGSTGKPKIIELQKEHMANSALATGEFFNCKENTKALLCLSANYIAGKMMLVRAMVLGWNIYLVEPSSSFLADTDDEFDFSAMVPLQVEASLQDLHKIKQLIIGGAPVSNSLNQQLQNLTTKCYATYGMTETITHIAVKKLNNLEAKSNESELFKILPNVTIKTDNRECLVINAAKVSNEQIVTNDIVKLHSSTSFQWLGRYDNVINSGGVKLFPEQIEEKLSQLIKIPFFVASLPNERLGQKLVLIIESNKTLQLSKEKLKEVGLTNYQFPKEVYSLPVFIRTATGKVQRIKTLDLL